jgi:hypothetical protein
MVSAAKDEQRKESRAANGRTTPAGIAANKAQNRVALNT